MQGTKNKKNNNQKLVKNHVGNTVCVCVCVHERTTALYIDRRYYDAVVPVQFGIQGKEKKRKTKA